jgi:SAM-dependent methyltransferase
MKDKDSLILEELTDEIVKRQLKSGRQSGMVLNSSVIGNDYLPELLKKFQNREPKDVHILDAGSGKHAIYTQKLRELGYDAKAIDLPENMVQGLHNPDAFDHQYDVAFSSRVLNVFSDPKTLEEFIANVSKSVKSGGYYLCNLPISPRDFGAYVGMSVKEGNEFLRSLLAKHFSSVEKIGERSGPVFLAKK